jgi:hypothetical protein
MGKLVDKWQGKDQTRPEEVCCNEHPLLSPGVDERPGYGTEYDRRKRKDHRDAAEGREAAKELYTQKLDERHLGKAVADLGNHVGRGKKRKVAVAKQLEERLCI